MCILSQLKKEKLRTSWSCHKDSKLPMQETPVGSLVAELRFHKPQDTDKNLHKEKKKKKTYTWVVSENCAMDSRSFSQLSNKFLGPICHLL